MTKEGSSSPYAGVLMSVRRTNLVDEVIARIRAMIEARDPAAGDRLPSEAEMAKGLGVGRSTLREAIRVLAHLGLVESRNGTGTFVTGRHLQSMQSGDGVSIEEMQQVLDFRYGVELVACRLAAERRSSAQMQAIRDRWAACMALAGTDDHAEFASRDYGFHNAVVLAASNELLSSAYAAAGDKIRRSSQALLELGPLGAMDHFHDALIKAIHARDGQAATKAARQNFDDVAVRLRLLAS
jgi:GntR family transcriptional regulator, transcriptional repressor for pyruvate dehydrogenase complex